LEQHRTPAALSGWPRRSRDLYLDTSTPARERASDTRQIRVHLCVAKIPPVHTENFVRIESTNLTAVCEIIIVFTMSPVFIALLALAGSTFQTRAAQQAEIAALRHQIAVLQRSAPRRLRLKQSDRMLWIFLSRFSSVCVLLPRRALQFAAPHCRNRSGLNLQNPTAEHPDGVCGIPRQVRFGDPNTFCTPRYRFSHH
jgi:hypothetical protein